MAGNTLYYGDNLEILREHIPSASVDLIYLDPPFNSNRSYNVLFKDESGTESEAQITAFEDTWHWNLTAEETYQHLVLEGSADVSSMVSAMRQFIGTNQMMAYLVMMAVRLVELHRVLKPTGSLYLHCDPTASHYLKIVLDTIFGPLNFRNEIVWKRTTAHSDSRNHFSHVTDTILFYARSKATVWRPIFGGHSPEYLRSHYSHRDADGRVYRLDNIIRSQSMGPRPNLVYEYKGFTPPYGWRVEKNKLIERDNMGRIYWAKTGTPYLVRYLDEQNGDILDNLWNDIPPVNSQAIERLGYPTQKPLALLERIVTASSDPGDVVLDPFCGCGTAIAAAQKLGRQWIGIDITHLSIALQKYRLTDMFPDIQFKIVGEPEDLGAARQLASEDRYQFQWWALSKIQARPLGGEEGSKTGKKGSDRGIDGLIPFIDDATGKAKRVIVQVKSGHVKSGDIRDLRGTVEAGNAAIGVFITLEEPSKDMTTEAVKAGFYHSDNWNKDYPKIQILTVDDLLHGAEVKMPPRIGTFKQAAAVKENANQPGLALGIE